HVEEKDIDVISFFRMTRPIAYSVGPLIASFVLFFLDYRYIFLVLGVIMLLALRYSLTIEDTK
ncbi:MAG: hypothetical protein KAR54_02645, partial [Candidatus Pacebacteria bacterium]|nr:hypothetical protein [Candidatus Paceibacterota bacterium]